MMTSIFWSISRICYECVALKGSLTPVGDDSSGAEFGGGRSHELDSLSHLAYVLDLDGSDLTL